METSKSHIVPSGLKGSDRPGKGPEKSRPESTPGSRHVYEVLRDLSRVRVQYEDVRSNEQARAETAQLHTLLHDLRAEAAQARLDGAPL